eukprot:2094922-Lingulodinium_polyedra.AAC.1
MVEQWQQLRGRGHGAGRPSRAARGEIEAPSGEVPWREAGGRPRGAVVAGAPSHHALGREG